jgi:hypothetical protein
MFISRWNRFACRNAELRSRHHSPWARPPRLPSGRIRSMNSEPRS